MRRLLLVALAITAAVAQAAPGDQPCDDPLVCPPPPQRPTHTVLLPTTPLRSAP